MEFNENEQIGLAPLATEIVTLDEVKDWALIDGTIDDPTITNIIVTARQMIENYISKDVVSKDRISFVGELEAEGDYYVAELEFPAKADTLVVEVNGITLVAGEDYSLVGINGRYIKFSVNYTDITITYESRILTSPSEVETAKSACKMLIEQIYNNRGILEGTGDIMIMDRNIKLVLTPLRFIYM